MTTRELFGGAITAIAPKDLVDASNLRQVPDTQEVFMYPECGISIIVEILARVEPSQPDDAVKFHFDSIAHDNSAHLSQVESVNIVENDHGNNIPSSIRLAGLQTVSKFNRDAVDQVRILMALYRIEEKGIDLVLTFNIPIQSEDGGAVDEAGYLLAQAQFDQFASSLRVVDFELFA